MFLGLPVALQSFISTILWTSYQPEPLVTFQLRHQHAITNTSRIIFSDYAHSDSFFGEETEFAIQARKSWIPRPESHAAFMAARADSRQGIAPTLDWADWDVVAPDVSKRSTLHQLAAMSFNAYAPNNSTPADWYDLSDEWRSDPHGWGPDDDALRGHIFVSSDNTTVIISIKGTSAGWLVGGGGPTVAKDKRNDNLLFSCCCARVGPTWSTVCGCHEGGYRCDTDCVEDAMKDEGLFYPIGLNLYNNVSYMYPQANIWLTGHSLGGGLAALVGATFGAPVVAFEAPAERLASRRLHLPHPPTAHHITHVYNTADPIPMGTCTGVASTCALGGFALETRCHNGQVILYDTVQKLGWSVNIRNHGIKLILDRLFTEGADWKDEYNGELDDEKGESGLLSVFDWGWGRKKREDPDEPEKKPMREVPLPRPANEVEGTEGVCSDCFNWEFGNFRNRSLTANNRCH